MTIFALTAFGAYLLGAFSPAYWVGRHFGIDLREFGTGNLGSSNVYRAAGGWASVAVGLLDIAKGMAPVLAARFALDMTPPEYMGVGLAAMAGHIWPVFHRFAGGRGMATGIGAVLGGSLLTFLIFIAFVLIGIAKWRQHALFLGLGIYLTPLWATLVDGPPGLVAGCGGVAALVAFRRALGGPGAPAISQPLWQTLLYRILFDRDTRTRESWFAATYSQAQRPL